MTAHKIFMSNLGYLRCINGRLAQHLLYAHRHIYCSIATQRRALQQLTGIIETETPDLCCFVEIDQGSSDGANFNQLEGLVGEAYPFFAIENKYGESSLLRRLAHTRGKSSAFIARRPFPYEKIYFTSGTKRLIFKISLADGLTLFFAHFSLKKAVRHQQLLQVRQLLKETPGEVIFLGDFNILTGLGELAPLLADNNLNLLNDDSPTFIFHRFEKILDLCICSQSLTGRVELRVIPQPFSDHSALLLHIDF